MLLGRMGKTGNFQYFYTLIFKRFTQIWRTGWTKWPRFPLLKDRSYKLMDKQDAYLKILGPYSLRGWGVAPSTVGIMCLMLNTILRYLIYITPYLYDKKTLFFFFTTLSFFTFTFLKHKVKSSFLLQSACRPYRVQKRSLPRHNYHTESEHYSWETSVKQQRRHLRKDNRRSEWEPRWWVFTREPNLCLTFVPDRSGRGLVVFGDRKSTEARCGTKMWEGSWWGCLWLIFPLATWQGEDKALIMNCDTLMSLSSSDNTWPALLPFNLYYQWGKLQVNEGFVSQAETGRDFKKQRTK